MHVGQHNDYAFYVIFLPRTDKMISFYDLTDIYKLNTISSRPTLGFDLTGNDA